MKPATLFPLRFSLFTRALLLGVVSAGLACAQDADRDGIPDASDPFPGTNAVVADPDGNNNLPASLQTGLIGAGDCQQIVPTGGYHGFADLAGNDQPLACRSLSMSLDPAGIISKAALFDGGNDHLAAPGTLFHNRAAFTTSLRFKTAPVELIQNKPGTIHTGLLCLECSPRRLSRAGRLSRPQIGQVAHDSEDCGEWLRRQQTLT